MAYTIISTCTACDLCVPQCPIDAISIIAGKYLIDQTSCCDFEDCLAVCPVNAIVPSDSVMALDAAAMASAAFGGSTST